MQFSRFILAVMVIALTVSIDFTTAVNCGVKPPNLRTVQSVPIDNPAASKTNTTSEERAPINAGAAARVNGGAAIPISSPVEATGGKTVTVTTYSNDGLLQRVGKWWNSKFTNSSR